MNTNTSNTRGEVTECPVKSVDCPSDETLRDFAAGNSTQSEVELEKRIADCIECKRRACGDLELQTGELSESTMDTMAPPVQKPSSKVFQASGIRNADLFAGEYEILDEIGAGGMGVVFKAHHRRLDRIVALKCIRSGKDAEPVEISRFENEVKALAKLNHPSIVQVFECGYFEGYYFYSMQYIEGSTLEVRLARDESQIQDAVRLMINVASAIAHAHHHGVIHRDLKPGNIMVEAGSGDPKVVDFGLAKHLKRKQHLTNTKAVLGTPVYMPPEQASGKMQEVNELSDVFSLGAVLYSTLAGRTAFNSEKKGLSLMDIANHRANPPSLFNPSIDADLDAICLKCMAPEKYLRYSDSLELQKDLRDYLAGKPVSANPRSVLGTVWKWYTADSRIMLVVAGILQIAVSLAFILWGLCGILIVLVSETPDGLIVRNFITEVLLAIFAMYIPLCILGGLTALNFNWASKISLGYFLVGIVFCLVFMAPVEFLEKLPFHQVAGLMELSRFARMQLCNLIGLIIACCAATHTIPILHARIRNRRAGTGIRNVKSH